MRPPSDGGQSIEHEVVPVDPGQRVAQPVDVVVVEPVVRGRALGPDEHVEAVVRPRGEHGRRRHGRGAGRRRARTRRRPVCGRAPSAMVLSPWGSRSMTSVRRPRSSAADARPRVTDVLPTPPLRLHTPSTSTCATVSGHGLRDENRRPDIGRSVAGGTAALVRTDWTMSTRLTRWGHACIRLDRGDDRLVIDPGAFSDARPAPSTASRPSSSRTSTPTTSAIEPRRRGGPGGRRRVGARSRSSTSWSPRARRPTACTSWPRGDAITAGGFDVAGAGGVARADPPGRPARAQRRLPRRAASCTRATRTSTPAGAHGRRAAARRSAAPWLKLGEVVDYVRSVQPGRLVVIHDALLSASAGAGDRRCSAGSAARATRSRSTPARASTSELRRRTAGARSVNVSEGDQRDASPRGTRCPSSSTTRPCRRDRRRRSPTSRARSPTPRARRHAGRPTARDEP